MALGPFGGVGAVRNANQFLSQDLGALRTNQLGMTDAEKRQYEANATQAAGQQIGAQQAELARQAMAQGGGSPFAGQAGALQMRLGQQAANAGAQAAQSADQLSQQMSQQRAAQIRQRLDEQRARAHDNFWNGALGLTGEVVEAGAKSPWVGGLVKKLIALKHGAQEPGTGAQSAVPGAALPSVSNFDFAGAAKPAPTLNLDDPDMEMRAQALSADDQIEEAYNRRKAAEQTTVTAGG